MHAKDSKEEAEDQNDAKFTNAKEGDAEFLISAAEINLEEIQLGRLAQKNSTMSQVIELGKMMELEHTKTLKDLQILVVKKQITIRITPIIDGNGAYDKLKNKFGIDFDNEYYDVMVVGHKDAINKFEKASTDAKDADIQSWAVTMLISLRFHLDHSITCQEKCAKMKSKS
jgi:putative membrane protein